MTVWRQAWCYVARKREKTVVVVAILVTIMVLLSVILTMQQEESGRRLEAGQGIQQLSQMDMQDIETFETVQEGSRTMQSLLRVMVFVLTVMSVVVLTCLLLFRIRERAYEIGVLISVGRGKGRIVAQLTAEMLYLMGMSVLPALAVSAGLVALLGFGIHPACFLEAIGIWAGAVLVSLVVSALGIMTKNPKAILLQID